MRFISVVFLFILSFLGGELYAQCGELGNQMIVSSQIQLDELSGCEIIQGDLIISSTNINDLSALNQLTVVNGSFYVINTSVVDLSPLSSLNNAQQVILQGNTSLTSCCEILQFIEAAELGTIMNVSLVNNGILCDDMDAIMLDCLGYIEGCTDTSALNFNENASVDDGSCEYFCPESIDDIIDYSCEGTAYPVQCEAQIINKPNNGAGHYSNPIGLCYEENPPSSGPHRPMWGKWGEYEFMPPQRYIHNLEHGGIALLYHPCVEESIIDSLRTIACSRPDDDGGAFRWILTPYVDLPTNIAVVAWEWTYLNDCFDAEGISIFIDEHYRNAPEDFYYNGSYDTLYVGKCEAYGCTDSNALNYDSTAVYNNNICEYPDLDTHLVVLNQGWNLFSTYVEPVNNEMSLVFQNIIEQTVLVKNNEGVAFLPDWGVDINLTNGEGYLAKVIDTSNLEVVGAQIAPEESPIFLQEGWNMIAYLREDPADAVLVFEEISDNIIIVKDGLGNVYYPDWGFSNLGDLKAGEGYQIKMSSTDALYYLSNEDAY